MEFQFFSAAREFGGGERYLTLLVAALRQRGHVVRLELHPQAPVALQALQAECSPSQPGRGVQVFNGIGSLYRWGPAHATRAAASMYVHHTALRDDQGPRWKAWLRPLLLRWFGRHLGTIVRVCRAALPDHFGRARIVTIHNGVPPQEGLPAARAVGSPFVLGMVGAVNANKNQRAALELLRALPSAFQLRVIGNGPDAPALRQLATQWALDGRVEWTGFTNQPLQALRSCHCMLVLSRTEAFPFSALEALSVGVPVLAYGVGGLPELLGDGRGGQTVAPGDAAAIRAALLRLEADEALRGRCAQQALDKIRTTFNVNHMTDQFVEAAQRTVEGSRR